MTCLRSLNQSALGQGESRAHSHLCAWPSSLCPAEPLQETGWNPSPFTQSQAGWQLEEKPLSAIAEQVFSYPGKRQCCYLRVFVGVRDLIWNSGGGIECKLLVVLPRSED